MSVSNYKLQEFYDSICSHIRYKGVHKRIIQELEDHIQQQKLEYTRQGMDEETALQKAIEQMGDPEEIGSRFDKTYRPRTDWALLTITLILVLCGGIIQAYISKINPFGQNYFSRFLFYLPLGLLVAASCYFFDYMLMGRFSRTAYGLLSILTAAGFLFVPVVNGSYFFVYYAVLLYIPVYAAIIYGLRNKGYKGLLISFLFYLLPALYCIIAPKLSMLFLFTVASIILLTFAIVRGYFGIQKKPGLAIIYIPFITITGALLLAFRVLNPTRFMAIFHPETDATGHGYQALLVKELISGAKLTGSATLGTKYTAVPLEQILPGWNSDFLLTYIIAKFGYIAGSFLIAILLLFIIKLFITVLKEKNAFGFLLSLACCIAFSGQIIFFVISNLGFVLPFPYTLPFISFGSISFITNMALLGLLLSVYRRSFLIQDRLNEEGFHHVLSRIE